MDYVRRSKLINWLDNLPVVAYGLLSAGFLGKRPKNGHFTIFQTSSPLSAVSFQSKGRLKIIRFAAILGQRDGLKTSPKTRSKPARSFNHFASPYPKAVPQLFPPQNIAPPQNLEKIKSLKPCL